MQIFTELSTIILITTLVAFVLKKLHQPLVVAYIFSGILVGPSVLNLLHSHETIELFSKLGISILLFIVGLHLSPKVIKEVGSVSLVTGISQVALTSTIGFGIAYFLGLDTIAAMYVGIALTFSSTIIILKLLSDKGDIHTLYGKITIGLLLVQDILATVALVVISALTSGVSQSAGTTIGLLVVKVAVIVVALILLLKFALPKLLALSADSSELLFLFSLAWGLGFAILFQKMGLSVEIGALISGVTLSATPYADEMSSRLKPLRDFFVVLFFVLLGSSMELSTSPTIIIPVTVLSFFVLIGNPSIVIIILNLLGYHKKTGFQTGMTVAQISEFSLILATLGFRVGHIAQSTLTIITLVGLITISVSTYLIMYSEKIYTIIEKYLTFLELRKNATAAKDSQRPLAACIFGYNRAGIYFLDTFKSLGLKTGIVDFDPTTEARVASTKIPYFYGDAQNVEFLGELPLGKMQFLVSTIKNKDVTTTLLATLKPKHPKAIFIVFAESIQEALLFYDLGANYVVLPHMLGAQATAQLVSRVGFNASSFARKRDLHLKELS